MLDHGFMQSVARRLRFSAASPPQGQWEIALLAAMLFCACALIASEIGYSRAQEGHDKIFREMAALAKLSTLLGLMTDAETSQRGQLLTGRSSYLDTYKEARPKIDPLVAELRGQYSTAADPTLLADFDRLEETLRERLSVIEVTLGMAERGQIGAARELVLTDIGKEKMDLFRARLAALQTRERENSARTVEQWQTSLGISRVAVALSTLVNLGLLAISLFRWRAERDRERRRQAELDRLVAERTSQLEVLASHLQQVSEDEKAKIARELHDHLGAILTAAKMDMAWVKQHLGSDREILGEKLSRALKNLDQGVLAKRRIIENLVPSTLRAFGLVVSLRELAENMEASAGWTLALDLPEEEIALSADASIALFRIAQESINNAAKYASAKTLRLTLTCEDLLVALVIRDDGVGFDPSLLRHKSYGLAGMRQRMIGLGGALQIESHPGGGTTVRARLPRAMTIPEVVA